MLWCSGWGIRISSVRAGSISVRKKFRANWIVRAELGSCNLAGRKMHRTSPACAIPCTSHSPTPHLLHVGGEDQLDDVFADDILQLQVSEREGTQVVLYLRMC